MVNRKPDKVKFCYMLYKVDIIKIWSVTIPLAT